MVEEYTLKIPVYGKELRAALKAARAGYEPDACELLRFDRATACRLLDGKTVVLVGDSLTHQLWLSLVLITIVMLLP